MVLFSLLFLCVLCVLCGKSFWGSILSAFIGVYRRFRCIFLCGQDSLISRVEAAREFEQHGIATTRGNERQPERAAIELRQRQTHLRQAREPGGAPQTPRARATFVALGG